MTQSATPLPQSCADDAPQVATRGRNRRWLLVAVAGVLLVALYHVFWHYHLKRFATVRSGVLYRSGQPSELGLWYAQKRYGIRTVLSTRRYRKRLRHGLFDPDPESGQYENDYVASLGIHYLQWPQGDQSCWPWPTPRFFEEVFRLIDEPANHPVLVHCMGGRHRTGTVAALFRLEYDRWPVERVLEEMYGYDFGPPIAIHEHNLRTYWPRPRPDASTGLQLIEWFWPRLSTAEGEGNASAPRDYEQLVYVLRQYGDAAKLTDAVRTYLDREGPFGLELAHRLIDTPDGALARFASKVAVEQLDDAEADFDRLATAAAIIADFGSPDEQQRLLEMLAHLAAPATTVSQADQQRYEALVTGVTNRYTINRIPYWRPLLDDRRNRILKAATAYRYCDTAVARLSATIDRNMVEFVGEGGGVRWDRGREEAIGWLDEHPEYLQLRPLVLPGEMDPVRPDPGHPTAAAPPSHQ